MKKRILLSTHILSEAQQICNRVLIINKGHIVAENSPEHLQNRLARANRVTLRIRGGVEDLLPLVQAVPGIITATIHSDDTLEFKSAPNQDARPGVARTVIEHGFDLSRASPWKPESGGYILTTNS